MWFTSKSITQSNCRFCFVAYVMGYTHQLLLDTWTSLQQSQKFEDFNGSSHNLHVREHVYSYLHMVPLSATALAPWDPSDVDDVSHSDAFAPFLLCHRWSPRLKRGKRRKLGKCELSDPSCLRVPFFSVLAVTILEQFQDSAILIFFKSWWDPLRARLF